MDYSDVESTAHPDGLQEIRSWASRSPDSVRPEFRTKGRPGRFRRPSRFAGSALLAVLLIPFSLAGYRFFRNGQGTPDRVPVPLPEPVEVVASTPVPAPPDGPDQITESGGVAFADESLPDSLPVRREPLRVQAAQLAPREHRPKEPVIRRQPARQELKASPVAVSRDDFESEPAVLLSPPAAQYPEAARGTGTSAEVTVGFTIDEAGTVRGLSVESSQVRGDAPETLFEEAALAAARRARFHPAQERGIPTRSRSTLTFSFETGASPAGS